MSTSPSVADLYVLNHRGFGTHQAMRELVRSSSRVLDVGCAAGLFGALLREERGCHVVGLEFDGEAAELARGRLDDVVVGDVMVAPVRAELSTRGPFDHVVMGDVLEHLVDPAAALAALLPLLAPGGTAVISLPNVLSLRPRMRLALGTWRYEDNGPFDRTHLRFFSVEGARQLVRDAGLTIERELPVGPLTHRFGRRAVRATLARPGLLATQLVLSARA